MKSKEFNINVDISSIEEEIHLKVKEDLKQYLQAIADKTVNEDYELGRTIKVYTKNWIEQNLKEIVETALCNIDYQKKVEQATEKAVLDLVHNHLKRMRLND